MPHTWCLECQKERFRGEKLANAEPQERLAFQIATVVFKSGKVQGPFVIKLSQILKAIEV